MQRPDLVLGYAEFAPEQTVVLYGGAERSLAGDRKVICREEVGLVWVRETHASACLTFKGRTVKRLTSYNDFYGLVTSAKTLFEEAPRIASSWKIEKTSELELHVIAWISDTPTLGFQEAEYGRRYYKPLPSHIWHDHPDVKAGEVLNSQTFPYDKATPIETRHHSSTVVWKSSASDEDNDAAFKAYEALVKADQRVVTETDVEIPD